MATAMTTDTEAIPSIVMQPKPKRQLHSDHFGKMSNDKLDSKGSSTVSVIPVDNFSSTDAENVHNCHCTFFHYRTQLTEIPVSEKQQEYDPFSERTVLHPNSSGCAFSCCSDAGALAHLLKSSLGTGILAMPNAIKHAGTVLGMILTIVIGVVCTHCVHLLVSFKYRAASKCPLGDQSDRREWVIRRSIREGTCFDHTLSAGRFISAVQTCWECLLMMPKTFAFCENFNACILRNNRATVAERLARSPPTKANWAQSPAGSPDFRKWESCRTIPLAGGFSRDLSFTPPLHSGTAPYPLQSYSSTLKASLLRTAQISSLHFYATVMLTLYDIRLSTHSKGCAYIVPPLGSLWFCLPSNKAVFVADTVAMLGQRFWGSSVLVRLQVKSSQDLCRRTKTPSMTFAETAEYAFKSGPPATKRLSNFSR
ncbi:hypothetical protein PR048_002834 [Dryococelus australis]|uniref:Amino acid transporter transmembrane domain-containing protein n=1 Tax=Dryococelus australis TaxID=614101 RepID=A0ABQ9ILX3_9NEOP|nr:hypothetical protein PR048_002834 [Dryococelus australis]